MVDRSPVLVDCLLLIQLSLVVAGVTLQLLQFGNLLLEYGNWGKWNCYTVTVAPDLNTNYHIMLTKSLPCESDATALQCYSSLRCLSFLWCHRYLTQIGHFSEKVPSLCLRCSFALPSLVRPSLKRRLGQGRPL